MNISRRHLHLGILILILLLIIIGLLVRLQNRPAPGTLGTSRYVTTSGGSGSGTCSTTGMVCTLSQGLSVMAAGDTMFFCAAACDGSGSGTFTSDSWDESFHTDGSAGSPYTFQNYPGETITIAPNSGSYGVQTGPGQNYITFKGATPCTVSSSVYLHDCAFGLKVQAGTGTNAGLEVFSVFSNNVTLQDVELSGTCTDGGGSIAHDYMNNGQNYRATRVYLHCSGNNYEDNGFYLQNVNDVVEDSEITAVRSAGIQFQAYTYSCAGDRASGNYIHDNATDPGVRYQAIVVNCPAAGSVTLYNNVAANSAAGSTAGGGSGGVLLYSGNGHSVYNNTFYNLVSRAVSIEGGTGHIVRNNIGYMTSGSPTFGDDVGGNTLNTNLTTDPSFVNAASSDFHILTGSAAKDAGVALGSPYNVDKDGVTRPQGSAWDMGAYEYNAGGGGGGALTLLRALARPPTVGMGSPSGVLNCSLGDMFIQADGSTGHKIWICGPTANTWEQQ